MNLRSIAACLVTGLVLATSAQAKPLSVARIRSEVEAHFRTRPGHRPDDLIVQSDVRAVVQRLQKAGWKVPDADRLTQSALPDNHPLATELRTPAGRKFMGKVSSEKLMYDRLDRIVGQSGGRALIRDLVKLPDGARYASNKRRRAVPGLRELLPKTRSGKTRKIANYDKPTGRIYTQKQLVDKLLEARSGKKIKRS